MTFFAVVGFVVTVVVVVAAVALLLYAGWAWTLHRRFGGGPIRWRTARDRRPE